MIIHNYNPNDLLEAKALNEAFDAIYDGMANYFAGMEFGVMVDKLSDFNLSIEGHQLILEAVKVRFANGYLYQTCNALSSPTLSLPEEGFVAGERRYIYLVYEGREAMISEPMVGKTMRQDIRAPKVSLILMTTPLLTHQYPQAVLVGGLLKDHSGNFMLDPLISPTLLHLGGHRTGRALIQLSQRYWKKLVPATVEIIRQIGDLPPGMYTDLATLAKQLDTALAILSPRFVNLKSTDSPQFLQEIWAAVAQVFLRHLDINFRAKRPKDSLTIINENTSVRGGVQMLDQVAIDLVATLAEHRYDPAIQYQTFAVIQKFLDGVIFHWTVLGDGHAIPLHQATSVNSLY